MLKWITPETFNENDYKETSNNLKCCGNCVHNNDNYCLVHNMKVNAYCICEHDWEFDKINHKERILYKNGDDSVG